MKIVIDTNVLISGIFWKGVPSKILELWIEEKLQFCATKEILREYLEIIGRKSSSKEAKKEWQTQVLNNILITKEGQKVKLCRDPDDDKFINCALAAKAVYIVSGDNDLLSLKRKSPVEIVTPAEFYRKWKD